MHGKGLEAWASPFSRRGLVGESRPPVDAATLPRQVFLPGKFEQDHAN